MIIRRALEKDIPKINDLLMQVCLVHHKARPDLFKYGAKKHTDEQLLEIIKDDNLPILVAADDNDEVMGYAFCIIQQHIDHNILTDIKTLYIDDLCVDEKLRGQHIASRLYDAVLVLAMNLGCYNVTLNVWNGNDSAIKFYESRGLKPQKIGMETIL